MRLGSCFLEVDFLVRKSRAFSQMATMTWNVRVDGITWGFLVKAPAQGPSKDYLLLEVDYHTAAVAAAVAAAHNSGALDDPGAVIVRVADTEVRVDPPVDMMMLGTYEVSPKDGP